MTSSDLWAFSTRGRVPLRLAPPLPDRPSAYPPLITRLLERRGIPERHAQKYFHPTVSDLTPVAEWPAAYGACRRLAELLSRGKRIHLHGDYDVDGITSVAILAAVLRRSGAPVTYTIPNRFRDGYGLQLPAVEAARGNRAEVLIAVDCGTNDFPAQQAARDGGMELIILDHHIPRDEGAVLGRLVNPHGEGCPAALRHLTSAGIAFEIALGLGDFTGKRENAVSLARLACMGIAQDVAPLVEDNRTIVKIGMENLPATKNLFLKGLLETSGLTGTPLQSYHLFYRLGPRLNAPGRMEDATFIVDLLLGGTEKAVLEGIEKIEALNKDRQALQERILEEAMRQADGDAPCIVAAGEGWHMGVVGLAAGKLASRFNRPAFVFSLQEAFARGSGRSAGGISLVETLKPVSALFSSFGGHDSACGITVERARWESARAGILGAFSGAVSAAEPPGMDVEEEVGFPDLDDAVCQRLGHLEPFGTGNPRPLFLARDVEIVGEPQPIGAYGFRFQLRQEGVMFPGAFFGLNSLSDLPNPFSPVFGVGRYRDRTQLSLEGYLS